jgi:predicted nucleic acid-binding protein
VNRFVLDASVVLSWFVDRPTALYANHVRQLLVRGSRAVVPALWQFEIANGFVVAERRRVLSPLETADALRNLDALLVEAIENSQDIASMRLLLNMAREFGLTAYDAAYLDTALRRDLPLATLDRQLIAAASKAGVEIVR